MARMHDADYTPPPSYWVELSNIEYECIQQIKKWGGIQHHKDDTGMFYDIAMADKFKDINEYDDANDTDPTWSNILLAEVYGALSETESVKLSDELVRVAAVCVSWLEDIRSREA